MSEAVLAPCIWIVFRDKDVLLKTDGKYAYSLPEGKKPPVQPAFSEHIHAHCLPNGTSVKAFSVSKDVMVPPEMCFIPLRTSFEFLPRTLYETAGKMEELIYWDKRNNFCSVCGAPMKYDTDISKQCTCCGHIVWPQLQTAIIVLVKRGDEILMVQSKCFRADYMGLVAGFVETGETLEGCVRREVMEETGINIKNIRYFRSQAWPYPCGLMVGFVADYSGGDLKLQYSELNKGGWFSRNDMPAIPGKVSLARRLIDAWLVGEI